MLAIARSISRDLPAACREAGTWMQPQSNSPVPLGRYQSQIQLQYALPDDPALRAYLQEEMQRLYKTYYRGQG